MNTTAEKKPREIARRENAERCAEAMAETLANIEENLERLSTYIDGALNEVESASLNWARVGDMQKTDRDLQDIIRFLGA